MSGEKFSSGESLEPPTATHSVYVIFNAKNEAKSLSLCLSPLRVSGSVFYCFSAISSFDLDLAHTHESQDSIIFRSFFFLTMTWVWP